MIFQDNPSVFLALLELCRFNDILFDLFKYISVD
jgi:hypothetical protein